MVVTTFYGGSLILTPIAELARITVDQVNFIFCTILAIGFGQVQRRCLSAKAYSATFRMFVEIIFGLFLCGFCFGYQIIFLFAQSIVALLILKLFPSFLASILVLVWSMGFMIVAHAYRLHYDYGGYTLDVTGPLMIQTQKLTSLAFNLYDGELIKKGKTVKELSARHAVTSFPTIIQYFAYMMHYHGILAGPMVFYNEYMSYINYYGLDSLPSAKKQIGINLALSVVHGILTGYIAPYFSYNLMASPEFEKFPMTGKLLYATVSLGLVRQKYYFAWAITETACISAGLGFSGFDGSGESQWETIRNSDIRNVEGGSSLKLIIDGWNIKSAQWLRVIVYERTPVSCRVFLTFLCSALWHGLYPGYYMFFLTLALFTITSRIVRRNLRPFFQDSPITAMAYDIFTTIVSNMALNYAQATFVLLELEAGLVFWKSMYFFPHSAAIFIIFCSFLNVNDRFALGIHRKKT